MPKNSEKVPKGFKQTASLIDKAKTVAGRLIRVWNTNKKKFSNARPDYICVWVENANGKGERPLLFTPNQIKVAEQRAKQNLEDLTKKDWITDLMD